MLKIPIFLYDLKPNSETREKIIKALKADSGDITGDEAFENFPITYVEFDELEEKDLLWFKIRNKGVKEIWKWIH